MHACFKIFLKICNKLVIAKILINFLNKCTTQFIFLTKVLLTIESKINFM